ncbi:18702_t:CDS:1, partial [Gigaspora margarita]
HVRATYACINDNISLYGVTYDPQNKIVSARKFVTLLDCKTNITKIIYNSRKRISGIGMVYNIQTRIYELDHFRMILLNN